MYGAAPALAYANLANPLLYPMEGMRAAIVGQEGFINYWLCLAAIILCSGILIALSLWLFKKRLDCVG